ISDIAKRTGLPPITPNLDLVISGRLGDRDFSAHSCRSFFAPTVPGSLLAENIMKSHNSSLETIVFSIMLTKTFGDKFFPSVGVLWHRRIGIIFFKWSYVRDLL